MCIEYLQTNYEYCQYRPSRIRIVQSSPVQPNPFLRRLSLYVYKQPHRTDRMGTIYLFGEFPNWPQQYMPHLQCQPLASMCCLPDSGGWTNNT